MKVQVHLLLKSDRFGNYQREEFIGSATAGGTAVSKKRFGTVTEISTEQDAGSIRAGTTRQLADSTIVASTTLGGAGFYTLADNAATATRLTDYGAYVKITSTGDNSAESVTIVGTSMLGTALSETVTLTNASDALSKNVFKSITSISSTAATTSATVFNAVTAYDSFVARGNMELSSNSGSPIKIALLLKIILLD